MGARTGAILALLAALILCACGGGEERVLTTEEYADIVVATWTEVEGEVDELVKTVRPEPEEIHAKFNEDLESLRDDLGELESEDDAFDLIRPPAEAFARAMLDTLQELLGSAAQALGEFLEQMQGLRVPEHLDQLHERLVLGFDKTKVEFERLAAEFDALDTDFSTQGEFEDFADELNRLVDNWDLEVVSDETAAACGALEEVLEEELGYEVKSCG